MLDGHLSIARSQRTANPQQDLTEDGTKQSLGGGVLAACGSGKQQQEMEPWGRVGWGVCLVTFHITDKTNL